MRSLVSCGSPGGLLSASVTIEVPAPCEDAAPGVSPPPGRSSLSSPPRRRCPPGRARPAALTRWRDRPCAVLPTLVTIGEDDDGPSSRTSRQEDGSRLGAAPSHPRSPLSSPSSSLPRAGSSAATSTTLASDRNRICESESLHHARLARRGPAGIRGPARVHARQLAGSGVPRAALARLKLTSEQWAPLVVVSNAGRRKGGGEQSINSRTVRPSRRPRGTAISRLGLTTPQASDPE